MRTDHVARARLLALQIGHHARMLSRSPMSAFSTLVLPTMVLLAVTLLNRHHTLASRGGISYAQFLAPAMVAFAIMNAGFVHVLTSLSLARERGILLRIRTTPMPLWIDMTARTVTAGVLAALSAVVVVAAGAIAYGVVVPWHAMPGAVLTGLTGLVCFAALGAAGSALIRNADSAMAVAWGVLLPFLFVSDVFLPLDGAPAWLRTVASAFPARHLALALEDAFNPVRAAGAPAWRHLAVLAAWTLAAIAANVLVARSWRGPRRAPGA